MVYKQLWILHMLRMLESIWCRERQFLRQSDSERVLMNSCMNAIVTADRIDSVNLCRFPRRLHHRPSNPESIPIEVHKAIASFGMNLSKDLSEDLFGSLSMN
ncbi:hypothetical protein ElyMa_000163800 [Elysia marginata]|uniref:Uncharacterized protein n=1 Tax=Elysia marginata TaxID=1093978 RepID=A0AAV4EUC4_9GAST|nr:hypothetical protein ElyMa_000163800 [Elysia marginata]